MDWAAVFAHCMRYMQEKTAQEKVRLLEEALKPKN